MIFSELYGAYYNAVAKIIESALDHPLKKGEIRNIAEKFGFGESSIYIEEAFDEQRWQLMKEGETLLLNKPTMPFTNLQKRWLKAISLDPRIKLFGEEFKGLEDVVPLFTENDIVVFDKYADGDPYEDENYIKMFRLMLDAIKNRYPLKVTTRGRKGNELSFSVMPEYLEYSEKDDKFRLIYLSHGYGNTLNLGRILNCEQCDEPYFPNKNIWTHQNLQTLTFELVDERNTLERALLHFAHFQKQAEKIDEKHYKLTLTYDKSDETEMLIRILSFGPTIRVTEPESFVDLIRERLKRQKSCER